MIEEIVIDPRPFEYTLSLFAGKWKMRLMYWISHYPNIRYGQLKKHVTGITHKMLAQQLKELEEDGMIYRKEYHEMPLRVEYVLSPKGESIMPILHEMCKWGHKYMP